MSIEAMLRKIKAKELKVGDVFTCEKYLYPHIVTRINRYSRDDRFITITYDRIDKLDIHYLKGGIEVLGEETEVYRFII